MNHSYMKRTGRYYGTELLPPKKGFVFDDWDTWRDFGLVTTKKDTTPPEPKTNIIELDGMNGSLDLSEALTGEITYHNRIITASFWTCNGTLNDRANMLSDFTAKLHGRKMKIYEPEDHHHYFYGRVRITSQKHTITHTEFAIEAVCDPWRYALYEEKRHFTVASEEQVSWELCNLGVKTVCPDITVDGEVTFTCNGVTSEATSGQYKITTFKLFSGLNEIMVSGNGTITLKYREAIL